MTRLIHIITAHIYPALAQPTRGSISPIPHRESGRSSLQISETKIGRSKSSSAGVPNTYHIHAYTHGQKNRGAG
ncbi:hypothetical protein F4820DRAFT_65994 [Hypoxylon rubiginosum]|uniref:Uncharacterized protein n=1 Tax=Hypoxylon rubiginosum TaxID=110542 RepID=A0ACB9YQT6_9PEZI|nr:hypothetical protein F4820DRAFT_65994 [Hypoxylon rubiginosum]